jgi:hypothetical protein
MHQTGTHTGVLTLDDCARALLATDLDHIPPTGRTVDVTGVVVLATNNGAVTRERHHWPRHWLYEHLGLDTHGPSHRPSLTPSLQKRSRHADQPSPSLPSHDRHPRLGRLWPNQPRRLAAGRR